MTPHHRRALAFDLLYQLLLLAYPAGFRRHFAPEMLQVAHDQQRQSVTRRELALTRLRLIGDALIGATSEWWIEARGQELPRLCGSSLTIALSLSLVLTNDRIALLLLAGGLSALAVVKLTAYGGFIHAALALPVAGALVVFNVGASALSMPEPLLLAIALLGWFLLRMLCRATERTRELPAVIGPGDLVGKLAEARTPLNTHGKVFVRGEWWNAISDERVSGGSKVQILAMQGLTLLVRPVPATQLTT